MKRCFYTLSGVFVWFLILNIISTSAAGQQLRTANGVSRIKALSQTNQFFGRKLKDNGLFEFYGVAVFDHLPDKQLLQELKKHQIQTISWIEKASYIVKITSKDTYNTLIEKDAQGNFPYLGMRSIGEVPLSLKLSTNLYQLTINPLSPDAYKTEKITIFVYSLKYVNTLKAYFAENGISVLENISSNVASNSISVGGVVPKQISDIAALNYVSNINNYADTTSVTGFRNSLYAQIYPVNYGAGGYTGRNNYSGNIENISASDPEILKRFRNRVITSTVSTTGTMGDHAELTTDVMASGTNFDELDGGLAPGTKLIQGYWDAAMMLNSYDAGYHPLSVNTSSFSFPGGQNLSSVYTSTVSNWDAAIRSHPDLQFAASSGNDGSATGINGYPPGWNNLIYGSGGKNSFTVSNIQYPGLLVTGGGGSCGPTNDGRLAPQICTEGQKGTSFASPNIAGQISDLFEAYTDVYHTTPRSDVVRAVMMNTAQDLYKRGPDFRSGYGESNPLEALRAIKEHTFYTGTVEQGENNTPIVQTLDITSGLRQLRVMLYWHDYQGTPNTSKILVNDLDLKVVTPAGDTILPWVLNINPAHVADVATRGIDSLNNQEQITIDDPQAGTYKLLVYGKDIPMGPQDYVLTYMQNPYHIKITIPDGFRLPAVNYYNPTSFFGFTWDYALNIDDPADSLQVFLQRQANEPFIQIGSVGTRALSGGGGAAGTIPAAESAPVGFYLNYLIPTDFPVSSTARVFVKQKNHPYADTSGYLLYSPMVEGLKVIASCPEKIILQWKKMDSLPVGGHYIIYRLGDTLMEPVDSVPYTQDSLTLTAAHILGEGQIFSNDEWFAVAARYPSGILSYRTSPVTQRMTNAVLAGSPLAPGSIPPTSFTLCKADTAILYVDPNYIKDSIRWFKDGEAVAIGFKDTLLAGTNDFGTYTYKSYYQGCAFESDTFYVNKSPEADAVTLSDTIYNTVGEWRCYVYKGDYDSHDIYGYFDMNNTDLNLATTDYYVNTTANPWGVPSYVGCPLTKSDFTLVMKRKGFPTGDYNIVARKGLNVTKLWIDGQLVYTSTTNLNVVANTVWSGQLTSDSKVRIELRSVGKSECAYDFVTDVADINLALHKSAYQATTNPETQASNAIDGDYNNVTSTISTANFQYMNIDLGDSAIIDRILLWNRASPVVAVDRLHNYYIFVSNDPFEQEYTDPSAIAARPGVYSIYRSDTARRPTVFGGLSFKGRYIRIQMNDADILNFSELEAFGQWLNPDSAQIKNLALHKSATQSSNYKDYYASHAVDGTISGNSADGSLASTSTAAADKVNPWWMVDLGTVCHITRINIYNRTNDPIADLRLYNYNILVSVDSLPMSTTTSEYPSATVFHSDEVAGSPSTFDIDVDGRYIALQLPGMQGPGDPDRMINFAELQALGYEIDSVQESALPVKWDNLTATAEKKDVLLKWSSIWQETSSSFDIERLGDDNQFKVISSVKENNSNSSDYQFKDLFPLKGTNTYRLKKNNMDGNYSYSPVRTVTFGNKVANNGFSIQPNPVNNILRVIKPVSITSPLVFRIIDASGRSLRIWDIQNSDLIIEKNVSGLAPGIYFLQIKFNEGSKQSLKFLKN